MKFAIAGTGYVGLSNAVLLARHHEVVANRLTPDLQDVVDKVYTRDLFGGDA